MTSVSGPAGRREARVLHAAARSFAALGYHGASLRDIADAVGMQAASLYHYADNKQELLVGVMLHAFAQRRQAVLHAMEGEETPEAQLRSFVQAYVRSHGENQPEACVCLAELRSLDPGTTPRVVAAIAELEALLTDVLQRGVQDGSFVIADMTATVRAFLDAWDGVALWYRADGDLSLSQIGERYAHFAVAAVAAEPPEILEVREEDPVAEAPVKTEILRVATELFAERSYSGTTVRALASRASVQPSVIYHYFGNKEGLLYAILSDAMRKILDEVHQALASSPRPPEQLAEWVRAQVRTEGASKYASVVSDAELHALSDRHRAVVVAQRRDFESLLTEVIEQGAREGLFATRSPKLTAYAIARICSGPGQWGSSADPARLRELGDRYAELILAGLGYREPVPVAS
jgi:AcrR family transcriptional regulator